MRNSVSISLIVPVYNVGPYVEDCLRSVMRQTYTGPIECIVVDDCGTDDSMEIVERLIVEYDGPISFKVLHHAENRGLSAARNTGMDAAVGDYFFFLDSDDELTDDCIEKLTNPLHTEWYDLVIGDLQLSDEDKKGIKLLLGLPDNAVLRESAILSNYRIKWNMMSQNKLYRAEFLKLSHLRFLEGLVYEDELWSFQVACLATSLYAVRAKTYKCRIRQDSLTATGNRDIKMRHIPVVVKSISTFAKDKKRLNAHTYRIILAFFYSVLVLCLQDKPLFVKEYRQMRNYARPSLMDMLRMSGFKIKPLIRDAHFLFPKTIAPYWLFTVLSFRRADK